MNVSEFEKIEDLKDRIDQAYAEKVDEGRDSLRDILKEVRGGVILVDLEKTLITGVEEVLTEFDDDDAQRVRRFLANELLEVLCDNKNDVRILTAAGDRFAEWMVEEARLSLPEGVKIIGRVENGETIRKSGLKEYYGALKGCLNLDRYWVYRDSEGQVVPRHGKRFVEGSYKIPSLYDGGAFLLDDLGRIHRRVCRAVGRVDDVSRIVMVNVFKLGEFADVEGLVEDNGIINAAKELAKRFKGEGVKEEGPSELVLRHQKYLKGYNDKVVEVDDEDGFIDVVGKLGEEGEEGPEMVVFKSPERYEIFVDGVKKGEVTLNMRVCVMRRGDEYVYFGDLEGDVSEDLPEMGKTVVYDGISTVLVARKRGAKGLRIEDLQIFSRLLSERLIQIGLRGEEKGFAESNDTETPAEEEHLELERLRRYDPGFVFDTRGLRG